jgi:hypothetical protein
MESHEDRERISFLNQILADAPPLQEGPMAVYLDHSPRHRHQQADNVERDTIISSNVTASMSLDSPEVRRQLVSVWGVAYSIGSFIDCYQDQF